MNFCINDHSTLWFSENALVKMDDYRQLGAADSEACGVLLGRLFEENEDIAVDDITVPQEQDVRRRTTVFRSEKHSELAIKRWRESGRRESFLGLWHTHPEDHPSPSGDDIADWEKVLRHGKFPGTRLVFVIVGKIEAVAWIGERLERRWNMKRRVKIRKLGRR